MQYIEAPSNEVSEHMSSLFLAGGITGCPDWQAGVVARLDDLDITVYNPRRKNFPIDDPNAAREQITWEFHRLNMAETIIFWFCKETVCPIVLYEYGRQLALLEANYVETRSVCPTLFVGMAPEYSRRQDVEIQTELVVKATGMASIEIQYSIPDLVERVRAWCGANKEGD